MLLSSVALDPHRDALPDQKAEKVPLCVRFGLGAGKGDLHDVSIADGGTVAPGHGGLAQHHLHALNMGSHLRRHGEGAGIGIGAGVGPHPQEIVVEGHHRIFQKHRHRPEKEILTVTGTIQAGGRTIQVTEQIELSFVYNMPDDPEIPDVSSYQKVSAK